MSFHIGTMDGVITVILMLLFIGIWIWAWRKKHKPTFDRMAALPMEDDVNRDTIESTDQEAGETHHD